ncbi:MAG: hypothetical protein ACTSU6_00695, partial [Candidatus Njordarchaeales archaeon]
YMDKVINDKETQEAFIARENDIDEAIKLTSPKTLLERKSKKSKAKKKFLSRDIDQQKQGTEKLLRIHKFIAEEKNEAKQIEKLEDIERLMARNELEIENIESSTEKNATDLERMDELYDANEEMSFAFIHTASDSQVKDLLKKAQQIYDNNITVVAAERQARAIRIAAATEETQGAILGGNKLKTGTYKTVKKGSTALYLNDPSIRSLFSMLTSRYTEPKEKGVFKNPLHDLFYKKWIKPAEDKKALMEKEYSKKLIEAQKEILGQKGAFSDAKLKNRLIDMSMKDKSDIWVIDENGDKEYMILSQLTAADIWLSLRNPNNDNSFFISRKEGGMGYTEETVKAIDKYLDADTKAYAEWMFDVLNKGSLPKQMDETKRKESGIGLDMQENYWPVVKEGKYKVKYSDDVMERINLTTGVNNRHMISRIKGDKTPLEIISIQRKFDDYISDAIRSTSWSEGVRELSYVFHNPKVKAAINQEYGTEFNSHMNYYINRFAGNAERLSIKTWDKTMDRLAKGILFFRILTGEKQVLSTGYYGLDMPQAELWSGVVKMINPVSKRSNLIKDLFRLQPFVIEREGGLAARNLDVNVEKRQKDYEYKDTEWGKKLRDARIAFKKAGNYLPSKQFEQAGGYVLTKGDRAPIFWGGGSYLRYKYKKYTGHNLTSKVLQEAIDGNVSKPLQKALDEWALISEATQQSLRESNVSKTRGSSTFGRTVNAFTSGQAQIWRIEMEATREMNRGRKTGDRKLMGRGAKKFIISHVLGGMAFGLAKNRFKWDDEEVAWSVILGNSEGLAYIGKMIAFIEAAQRKLPWGEHVSISPVLDNWEKITINYLKLQEEVLKPEREQDKEKTKKYRDELAKALLQNRGINADGIVKFYKGWGNIVEGESTDIIRDALGQGSKYTEDMPEIWEVFNQEKKSGKKKKSSRAR